MGTNLLRVLIVAVDGGLEGSKVRNCLFNFIICMIPKFGSAGASSGRRSGIIADFLPYAGMGDYYESKSTSCKTSC